MTDKEKATRYDEAIEIAKEINNEQRAQPFNIMTRVFPELKENEDERIREAIINVFATHKDYEMFFGVSVEDIRAWLFKPSEKKSLDDIAKEVTKDKDAAISFLKSTGIMNENGELADEYKIEHCEQKSADKVEPKFHEGEWVVYKNDICQIVKREEGCNKLVTVFGIEKELVNERNLSTARLWTIQDAKDGDVLCCESGWTCIFKALNSDISFSSYCFMDGTGWFCETGSESHTLDKAFIKAYNGNIYPATKEQRDTLMKAMADAGYTFDFEKKELKKIEQKPAWSGGNLPEFESYLCLMLQKFRIKGICTNGEIIDYVKEHSQKLRDILVKPAWNEEDENWFKEIELMALSFSDDDSYRKKFFDWLKSLKDRVLPQQEWSEEDKYYYDIIQYILNNECVGKTDKENAINWFKSLRPQNTWKPSEEQIKMVDKIINTLSQMQLFGGRNALIDLKHDLEKLREE